MKLEVEIRKINKEINIHIHIYIYTHTLLSREATNIGSSILLNLSTLKAQIFKNYQSNLTSSNKFTSKIYNTKRIFFTNREVLLAIKTF